MIFQNNKKNNFQQKRIYYFSENRKKCLRLSTGEVYSAAVVADKVGLTS